MPFYRPGVIYLRLSGDANKWQSRHNSPSSHPDARYRACADFTGVLSPLLLREQWERDEMSRSWPSFWWLYNLAAFCDFWGTGVRYIGAAFGVGWIEYLTLGTAEAFRSWMTRTQTYAVGQFIRAAIFWSIQPWYWNRSSELHWSLCKLRDHGDVWHHVQHFSQSYNIWICLY